MISAEQSTAVERLEPLLQSMIVEHECLLELCKQHQDAIRIADTDQLAKVIEQTNEIMCRIGRLDQQRDAIARSVSPATQAQPTITEMSRHLPEPARGRTKDLADQLRGLAKQVHEEHTVLRAASEVLMIHMSGLMQQVSQRLSHSGTYGRHGVVEAGSQQVVSGIDIRR